MGYPVINAGDMHSGALRYLRNRVPLLRDLNDSIALVDPGRHGLIPELPTQQLFLALAKLPQVDLAGRAMAPPWRV